MSKTEKTAVVLAMAAGAVFLGIPLLDKCLGWFGCAFRPWVLSAAIVVPTVEAAIIRISSSSGLIASISSVHIVHLIDRKSVV